MPCLSPLLIHKLSRRYLDPAPGGTQAGPDRSAPLPPPLPLYSSDNRLPAQEPAEAAGLVLEAGPPAEEAPPSTWALLPWEWLGRQSPSVPAG